MVETAFGERKISLLSPAKVNLFFRVLKRREDGYHEIASLYQAIDLFDTLTLSLSSEDQLSCTDPQIPCDASNLIHKALEKFRQKTGWHHPVSVHLEKKIPIQAGLGGGSGNAATMLWGLNQLSGLYVSEEELIRWAGEFSSDAPFFFSQGTAYCTGRGELLKPVTPLSSTQFWIAKPDDGLSTPLVYKHCRANEFEQRDPLFYLEQALKGQLETFNDLEHPAFALMPKLKEYKEDLQAMGFSQVTMTGSGTGIMCFGHVQNPSHDELKFYPVSFINRDFYRARKSW